MSLFHKEFQLTKGFIYAKLLSDTLSSVLQRNATAGKCSADHSEHSYT